MTFKIKVSNISILQTTVIYNSYSTNTIQRYTMNTDTRHYEADSDSVARTHITLKIRKLKNKKNK